MLGVLVRIFTETYSSLLEDTFAVSEIMQDLGPAHAVVVTMTPAQESFHVLSASAFPVSRAEAKGSIGDFCQPKASADQLKSIWVICHPREEGAPAKRTAMTLLCTGNLR